MCEECSFDFSMEEKHIYTYRTFEVENKMVNLLVRGRSYRTRVGRKFCKRLVGVVFRTDKGVISIDSGSSPSPRSMEKGIFVGVNFTIASK